MDIDGWHLHCFSYNRHRRFCRLSKLEGREMLMEKQADLKNQLLTVKEVATYLVVTERTVYRLVKDRRFPAFKVGGQWRFKVDLIEAWMRRDRPFEYNDPQRLN